MPRVLLDDPRYYLNRHVQWLDFNRRVLEEARDPGNPLLERVKFLAITANNLWVILYRARMSLRECLELNWFAGKRA